MSHQAIELCTSVFTFRSVKRVAGVTGIVDTSITIGGEKTRTRTERMDGSLLLMVREVGGSPLMLKALSWEL